MAAKAPHRNDIRVGQRIRSLRLLRQMSQTEFAERLGLSFQQVQKYEFGKNRVGAGRLQLIAEILEVPVSFFFEDGKDEPSVQADPIAFEFLTTARSLRLMKAYSRLASPDLQRAVVDLVERLADKNAEEPS